MVRMEILFLLFSAFVFCSSSVEAGFIGVNYGRVADNLPPPENVVALLKSIGVTNVKLYDADPSVLRALAGSGINVVVTVPNELLATAATRPGYALAWVQRNVAAYYPSTLVKLVAVGNEVFADPHNLTGFLVPAMSNVRTALAQLGLDGVVKISSPIALTALQTSYPPSAGVFRPDLSEPVMRPMLEILRQTGSYMMVNAYPFFAYEDNADVISLDYALFRPKVGVIDAGSNLSYYSLLDAQIDAVFAAMSALSYNDIKIVLSETGWPSKGDEKEAGAGLANAAAYNGNLIRRVLSSNAGTPMRPQADLDIYLFALFNENQKPGPESERNYGLFYPDEQKVYDIAFSLGGDHSSRWMWDKNRSRAISPALATVRVSSTGATWCVANTMAGTEKLQVALDYACGEGGADCRAIQPGAACFHPNTLEAHASYAFNSYYQMQRRAPGTCDFEGAASVVYQPPKTGTCLFQLGV